MSYSLQTGSAAAPSTAGAPATPLSDGGERLRALSRRLPRPELALLLVLAAVLYLWSLSKNSWANDYYSAAVRSMSSSWHNFLFASADPSGVMTVDKPPLALWVQALSVRVFGYSSLSMLVPQALMGVASVGLLYDLVRRRFGNGAGPPATGSSSGGAAAAQPQGAPSGIGLPPGAAGGVVGRSGSGAGAGFGAGGSGGPMGGGQLSSQVLST